MNIKILSIIVLTYLNLISISNALVIGSDENEILIDANFSGKDLLVFGAFYADPSQPREKKGDILIEVVGPQEDIVLRKKESFFGFWLNAKSVTFKDVPSFYYLSSTSELKDSFFEENNIGLLESTDSPVVNWSLINTNWGAINSDKEKEEFYDALVRNKSYENVFRKTADEIEILDGNLFKTNIPIPNTVPVGVYDVNLYLILNNKIAKDYSYNFTVKRIGIESIIYNFATSFPLIYGFTSLLIALIIGWISADLFRRFRKA